MKKKLLVAMITACLIVGGIAIVYNQYPNNDSNLVEETLISKEDFERMSKRPKTYYYNLIVYFQLWLS